jgi:hypothetical protein
MTLADWKELAAAIQSFAVAIAVLIGGWWALFRYRSLNEQARAKADLDRLRYAIERRSTVRITLGCRVVQSDAQCVLYVTVTIENSGTKTEIVDWSKAGVRTARVIGFSDGSPTLGTFANTHLVTIQQLLAANIDPGEAISYPFLVPVTNCGLYYVEFFFIRALDVITEHATFIEQAIGKPMPTAEGRLTARMFVAVPEHASDFA